MLLGGPLVMRAAVYTAGTVAALSLTAACAPDQKFLNWGGPLSLALGGICVASIGNYYFWYHLLFGNNVLLDQSQWAKSPKNQSVGVYFSILTTGVEVPL